MRKATRFLNLLFITMMATLVLLPAVKADSITREYDVNYANENNLTFNVKMIVETEDNGNWKPDTFYQIDYVISIAYVNEEALEGQSLRVVFYDPMVIVDDYIWGISSEHEVTENDASVWVGHSDTLTLKMKLNSGGDSVALKGMLNYALYLDEEEHIPNYDWRSEEPIWIDRDIEVISAQPDYTLPIIGVVVAVVLIVAVFMIKKSKRKNVE